MRSRRRLGWRSFQNVARMFVFAFLFHHALGADVASKGSILMRHESAATQHREEQTQLSIRPTKMPLFGVVTTFGPRVFDVALDGHVLGKLHPPGFANAGMTEPPAAVPHLGGASNTNSANQHAWSQQPLHVPKFAPELAKPLLLKPFPDHGDYKVRSARHIAPLRVDAPGQVAETTASPDHIVEGHRLKHAERAGQHTADSAKGNSISPHVVIARHVQRTSKGSVDPYQHAFPIGGETSREEMVHLGDGVGSMTYERSPTQSRALNHEFRKRLEVQDLATVMLLISAFALTLLVSSSIVYQVAEDPSLVLFYSDPKFSHTMQQRLVCSSADAEAFLRTFNTQPQCARLRIIGRSSPDVDLRGLIRGLRFRELAWHARQRISSVIPMRRPRRDARLPSWDAIMFDVSLDLTPFVTGDGRLASELDGTRLEQHLSSRNPLEVLILRKQVEWPCWEDIATNVRQRLRALGFPGEVEVRLEAREEVLIYRNLAWQNFVRSRITQALVLISIIGGIFWIPYLWLRMRTVRIESRFRISLDLARYWEHLSDGLHAIDGFQGQSLAR